jgi:beta-lactamase regulating signal transducer with metallopeptidase domain
MTLLLAALVDLAIILAAALSATLLMRRRPAALRHWILATAMLVGASAPALEFLLPEWPLPWSTGFTAAAPQFASTLRFTSEPAPVVVEAVDDAAPPAVPWTAIAVVAWLAGAIAGLLGLATGLVRLARFSARCTPIGSGPWRDTADQLSLRFQVSRVDLLQSADPSLLVTWGLFTPKIILPAGASAWTETRRRIVLAHEMAHIHRHDWLVHMSAEALRAIHWINPLAWLACRRLRQESEYACDDAVLSGGVAPTEYATHLLDVARQAIGHRRAFVSAPAIAHPSTLERRIAAMLTEQHNRAPLTRRAGAAALTAIVAVALPITALAVSRVPETVAIAPDVVLTAQPLIAPPVPATVIRPQPVTVAPAPNRVAAAAAQAPASVMVVVRDPSGGVLPGVEATLTGTRSDVQPSPVLRYNQVTDGAGRFSIGELQPGRYDVVLRLPGFATARMELVAAPGEALERLVTLRLGSLEETVTVVCGSPAAGVRRREVFEIVATNRRLQMPPIAAFAQNGPPAPVRVGGQISSPNPLRRVNPVCPNVAFTGDVPVVLEGVIGTNGSMKALNPLPPAAGEPMPGPEFVESAVAAVSQWTFTPTRLNNVPVEVTITVRVSYSRR